MMQSVVQIFINDLVVLAEAMSFLMTGTIKTKGDNYSRKWTYNITDFAMKGESY